MRANGYTRYIMAIAFAFLLALALTGCASSPSQQGGQNTSGGHSLHIALHADRAEFSSPEQLCNPLLTAEVVVGSHGVARWNTPDGARPNVTTAQEAMEQNLFIYTPLTFSQITPLHDTRKGMSPIATTTYITLGGQAGQDTYSVDGMPRLEASAGHYIVVLVPPSSTKGLPVGDILLVSYAFPVDDRGMVVLRQAGNPQEPGTGAVDSEVTIALADLKQALASCKV